MKTAVLLIVFNRLDYVKETLNAISKAKPPRLYIASDGPRPNKTKEKETVQQVRDYILEHINWPCEIHTRFLDINSGGCKFGVSGAVTWFFQNEKEGIILEDDCVACPSFFNYCEELLEKYRNDKRIWHIAGDAPIDVAIPETYYFSKIQHCWGWASWADRWQHFSLDVSMYDKSILSKFSNRTSVKNYWNFIHQRLNKNKIDTWDYQWTFHIIAHNGLCINPAHNLISNIGETGVHFNGQNNHLKKKTFDFSQIIHPTEIKINEAFAEKIYEEAFKIQPILKTKYYLFGFIPIFLKESQL